MKIRITLTAPDDGQFASIQISFRDHYGRSIQIPLSIDFEMMYDFSKETESTSFDMFLIASIVYGIDNLISRQEFSIDGWAREFEVTFPVNNLKKWQAVKSSLEECLTFLTGDHWQIDFSKIDLDIIFFPRKNRRKSKIPLYDKSKYKYVSLFSGGLDSLIGAIDLLEQLKKSSKILLVSHFDSNSVGPKKDQETLQAYLSSKYPKRVDRIFSTISVDIPEKLKKKVSKDSNYRSRSFLFISIANYLINSIPKVNELVIPENGTISLNHPLTPSRSSSLSTRTTHPFFIDKLNHIFSLLEIDNKVVNPYSFKTKGEIIEKCKNTNVLSGIFERSVSCAKRGYFRIWAEHTDTNHCGVCMPCIYRRAALNKLGWDKQLYGTDILSLRGANGFEDQYAFADYLKTNFSKEQIMRNLLVNGSLSLEILEQYAELVLRSREELKNWVVQKGNNYIKKMISL